MRGFDLQNKKIVLTGADGFLGRALHVALECEGAEVVGLDVKQSCSTDALDISNLKKVKEFALVNLNTETPIYGIVNNAAVSVKGRHLKEGDIDKTMAVNIKGTVNMMEEIKPLMHADGSIVNLASLYGMLSPDFSIYEGNEKLYSAPIYGATKAAIIQLTRYYASQFAPIRVNSVSPGGIYQNQSDDFVKKYSKNVPLKRMAGIDEVINAILFLLSPLSGYITGQNLVVDGGLSIW